MTPEQHTIIHGLTSMKTIDGEIHEHDIEIAKLKTRLRRIWKEVFDAMDKQVKNDN